MTFSLPMPLSLILCLMQVLIRIQKIRYGDTSSSLGGMLAADEGGVRSGEVRTRNGERTNRDNPLRYLF